MRIPIEDGDYADLLIHLPSVCQFIDHAIWSGRAILVHDVQVSSTPCRHRALRINYTVTEFPSQRGAGVGAAYRECCFLSTPTQRLDVPKLCDLITSARARLQRI
jgi:hypothetical protein